MAHERRPDMDSYQHLWSKARIANDAAVDAVTAEVTDRKPAISREGRLKAKNDYNEFRKVANPRLITELCKDHERIIRAYLRVSALENNRWPNGLKFVLIVLFGLAMSVVGGFFQQWYTGG